ncbi:MAG: hypothetical protein H7144_10495 [Burkholderiales bacterium]|nr:hypothetical protein [Phycisphaerae bacterium]
MNAAVLNILAQIELLDEAADAELRAALQTRSRTKYEKIANVERSRSSAQGVTEDDIDQAVDDIRYGKQAGTEHVAD